MPDWTMNYSVNVKEIDKQHKVLFSIINEINEILRAEKYNFKNLHEIIMKLDDYITEHFRFEEQLMLIQGYPFMEDHVKEHNQFRYDLNQFNIFDVKQPKEFLENGLEYLMKWLTGHIMSTDMKLGEFVNNTKI